MVFRSFLFSLLALAACHPGNPAADAPAADEAAVKPRAVVTVGAVQRDTVTDVLRLSAISAYPAKDVLRATTTGYLRKTACEEPAGRSGWFATSQAPVG